MKQIRRGVFETNSSSTHSLTLCSKDEYSKWEKGEVLFNRWNENFSTKEEAINKLKSKSYYDSADLTNEDEINNTLKEEGYYTESEFWDDIDMETFHSTYKTTSGEEVVAFGYYGYNS